MVILYCFSYPNILTVRSQTGSLCGSMRSIPLIVHVLHQHYIDQQHTHRTSPMDCTQLYEVTLSGQPVCLSVCGLTSHPPYIPFLVKIGSDNTQMLQWMLLHLIPLHPPHHQSLLCRNQLMTLNRVSSQRGCLFRHIILLLHYAINMKVRKEWGRKPH